MLAVTQSAFSPVKTAVYGKVITSPGHWTWEPLAGLTETTGPLDDNEYKCDEDLMETCTSVFDSPPSPDQVEDPDSSREGIFSFQRP